MSTEVKYNVVSREGKPDNVTVFAGGDRILVATAQHPQFTAIVALLEEGTDDLARLQGLFDVTVPVGAKFNQVTERVSVYAGHIFFDGDEVNDAIAQVMVRFNAADEDFMPLVNFMEKIAQNPQEHSRQHLFEWLSRHDYSLHSDGDFIAYKGVNRSGDDFQSSTSGRAIVNGQVFNGKIPNAPGTVITMPRSEVTFDPYQGCAGGLHAGNWRYAKEFASVVLQVKINPRDVVSVPTDSNWEKLRVCRYQVLGEVKEADKTLVDLRKIRTARIPDSVLVSGAKKKARSSKAAPKADVPNYVPLPRYYEHYTEEHFKTLPIKELRWLAREWEVKVVSAPSKDIYAAKLAEAAAARRRRRSPSRKMTKSQ